MTFEDWQMLTNSSLANGEINIGAKCLFKLADWPYLELMFNHFQLANCFNDNEKQILLAKYYAYQGLYSESAKIFKKINALHLASNMFTDLQMIEQAKEYQSQLNTDEINLNNDSSMVTNIDNQTTTTTGNNIQENFKQLNNIGDFNDIKTLSKMYIAKGDFDKAFDIIAKSNVNRYLENIIKLHYLIINQ